MNTLLYHQHHHTNICIVLVCGIPGCGKTTLISQYQQQQNQNPENTTTIHVIEYDQIQNDIMVSIQQQQQQEQLDHCSNNHTTTNDDDPNHDDDHHNTTIISNQYSDPYTNEVRHTTTTTATTNNNSTSSNDIHIQTNNTQSTNSSHNDTEKKQPPQQPSSSLHAWRMSRTRVLQQLYDYLHTIFTQIDTETANHGITTKHDDTTTTSTTTTTTTTYQPKKKNHIILLDDNFYLRSMRKQVYMICMKFFQQTMKHHKHNNNIHLYYGCIYIDTPLSICMERNQHRNNNNNNTMTTTNTWSHTTTNHNNKTNENLIRHNIIVSDDIITRMYERLEIPDPSRYDWEQASMIIPTNTVSSINDQIYMVQHFIQNDMIQLSHGIFHYDIANHESILQQQRQQQVQNDQTLIQHSIRHQADQFWRLCVSLIAKYVSMDDPHKIKMANQVRKYCIQSLAQSEIPNPNDKMNHSMDELSETLHDSNAKHHKLVWWSMFIHGIPNDNNTTFATTSSTDASCWLTQTEQEIMIPHLSIGTHLY